MIQEVHAPEGVLDFRSDTVTRPTPGMLQAMCSAPVGDDVLGDDPSVLALQSRVAELLGKEDALFVPSGTMSNLIGVMLHCDRGDEFICEAGCHIFNYEQSGYAQIGGIAVQTLLGERGVLQAEQLAGIARPENDHQVRTKLICLENTHNRGGGSITPLSAIRAIEMVAREQGLAMHLDGARLWNAAAATGVAVHEWASSFDTVSVCFSKGLGAPVGSALAGPAPLIRRARRLRKVLGGGMRQSGLLAAAASYALEQHRERLVLDHSAAKTLATALAEIPGIQLNPAHVETNIVIFQITQPGMTAQQLVQDLRRNGVWMLAVGPSYVRAVTHLDVSAENALTAGTIVRDVLEEWRKKVS